MTINPRSRVAALGLLAVVAVGACSGTSGGTTASPAAPDASAPAGASPATAGGPPDCLSFADIYALVGPVYPLLKRAFPGQVTTTEELARAMLLLLKSGFKERVLENRDIVELAASRVPLHA